MSKAEQYPNPCLRRAADPSECRAIYGRMRMLVAVRYLVSRNVPALMADDSKKTVRSVGSLAL